MFTYVLSEQYLCSYRKNTYFSIVRRFAEKTILQSHPWASEPKCDVYSSIMVRLKAELTVRQSYVRSSYLTGLMIYYETVTVPFVPRTFPNGLLRVSPSKQPWRKSLIVFASCGFIRRVEQTEWPRAIHIVVIDIRFCQVGRPTIN